MSGAETTAPAPPPAAPPPASTPAPAPAAREVAVDQNPVHTPAPVGSQAPPAREPQPPQARATSRREVINRAYQRAQETRAPTPPAEAKIGHNRPPEQIDDKEKPARKAEVPLDLRKPPPPERGERGRFVARDRQQAQANGAAGTAPAGTVPPPRGPQQQQQPVNPLPANAPYREAPPRMDARAKAEWHAAPESVRGAVHRMHNEFGRAYQAMQGDVAAFNEIRPYHDLARSQGTTLARAIANYAGMEEKLRRDPLGGLDVLVHNMNLRTADGQQITLRDIAHYIATQSPEQLQARESRNVQSAHNLQLGQLQNSVAALADSVARMHGAQQHAQNSVHTRRAVDRFAETHPRVDELGAVIAAELPASGYNLEIAYQRANLLHPTQAAQTRTPPAQTRAANRSIHGAPDGSAAGGSRSSQRRRGPLPPVRDSVAKAVQRVRGL